MEVTVNHGAETLETRECRILQLPDGREGAVWRGLAYALEGGGIDVSGRGISPALCAERGSTTNLSSYALRETVGGVYVLLAGSVTRLEASARALTQAGMNVERTGRYLNDPPPGFEVDWFIRIAGEAADVAPRIEASLGGPAQPLDAEGLRERLLAKDLERALERAAAAKRTLERLQAREDERLRLQQEVVANQDLVAAERMQREAAEAQARQAQAQADALLAERRTAPDRVARGVAGEIDDVLAALLPRIRLLRDSLDVVALEFSSRVNLYRALGELEQETQGVLPNWKALKGASEWKERHVSNGRDDQGRVYARRDRSDRSWEVLVSFKSTQSRDVTWLKKLP